MELQRDIWKVIEHKEPAWNLIQQLKSGDKNFGELADNLEVSKNTVRYYFRRYLEENSLAEREKEGGVYTLSLTYKAEALLEADK